MFGISSSRPILHMAATGLSKSYSLHGIFPLAISRTVHPKDQISADVPQDVCVINYFIDNIYKNLRRHPWYGPSKVDHSVLILTFLDCLTQLWGTSKIPNLNYSMLVHQHVPTLNITVHDPVLMQETQAFKDLPSVFSDFFLSESTLLTYDWA